MFFEVSSKQSINAVTLMEKIDILILLGVTYLFVSHFFKNKKETGKFFNPKEKVKMILAFLGIILYGIFLIL